MSGNVLQAIAEYKRREVAERRARWSPSDLEAAIRTASPPRGFRSALAAAARPGRPALIAEVKKASPSKGLIRADFDPAEIARAYADAGAACLSVLTDAPSFQGREEDLVAARASAPLPVLRKDFLLDPWQVLETRALGADAVLIILALLDDAAAAEIASAARELGMDALFETHDAAEMERAGALGADLVGVNNRDLRTFVTDLSVTERLAPLRPPGSLLVCESGLSARGDVARAAQAGAAAVLVGESLMRRPDVRAAVRDLIG